MGVIALELPDVIFPLAGDFTPDTLRRLLKHCVDLGASDVLLQSGDVVWAEIHGRQIPVTKFQIQHSVIEEIIPGVWTQEILGLIKSGVGADRALEISGEQYGLKRTQRLRFRCNFTQAHIGKTGSGISITMRVIPEKVPKFETMGIEEELKHSFFPADGLVLVCGPTGSGKTTLQAAMYNYIAKTFPDRKIVTLDDPIEYVLGDNESCGPKPSQSQIGRDVSDFATGIRGAMRRKPSIIGIGEARDYETINAMLQAASTGHLCYSTVHADSVAETVNRIITVFPAELQNQKAMMISGSIRVIVIQRLLKTLNGKRVAVREYMVFDETHRNALQDLPYERWPQYIRNYLEERNATIKDKSWELLQQNIIDDETFIEVAGYGNWKKRKEAVGEIV